MTGMQQLKEGGVNWGSGFHGAFYPGDAAVVTGGARGSGGSGGVRLFAYISVG